MLTPNTSVIVEKKEKVINIIIAFRLKPRFRDRFNQFLMTFIASQ